MTKRLTLASVFCFALLSTPGFAQTSQRVAVFVTSAGAVNGFPDPDKNNQDTVADLKASIADNYKDLVVVNRRDDAAIQLIAVGRDVSAPGGGALRDCTVRATLRFKDVSVDMNGTSKTDTNDGAWRRAADALTKQVEKWVAANRAEVPAFTGQELTPDTTSPAGTWQLAIQLASGAAQSVGSTTMTLKLDGGKITGVFAGASGQLPLTGEFTNGNLTLTVAGPDGAARATLTGKLNDDGTLSGTMSVPGSSAVAEWRAERSKGDVI